MDPIGRFKFEELKIKHINCKFQGTKIYWKHIIFYSIFFMFVLNQKNKNTYIVPAVLWTLTYGVGSTRESPVRFPFMWEPEVPSLRQNLAELFLIWVLLYYRIQVPRLWLVDRSCMLHQQKKKKKTKQNKTKGIEVVWL